MNCLSVGSELLALSYHDEAQYHTTPPQSGDVLSARVLKQRDDGKVRPSSTVREHTRPRKTRVRGSRASEIAHVREPVDATARARADCLACGAVRHFVPTASLVAPRDFCADCFACGVPRSST
eukprot:1638497-Prymnesium_polylepis.1